MAIAQSNRDKGFWFGTERRMQWLPTPMRGADMSPQGWNSEGDLLNGGAFNFSSFGSHKTYSFEWSGSSAAKVAQLMKSYADGTYGRELLYFQDCLMFEGNVLPARIADPSMALGYEGSTMIYGVQPTGVPQLSGANELPVLAARYNLATVAPGFRKGAGGVFIPIPEGYSLMLSAFYSATGTGGVYVTSQDALGNLGTTGLVPALADDATALSTGGIPHSATTSGVWLWAGRQDTAPATITLKALRARLIKTSELYTPKYDLLNQGPWMGGQGHSGCRFSGKPTYIANGPLNGGQIGFAATFTEVGSWANG